MAEVKSPRFALTCMNLPSMPVCDKTRCWPAQFVRDHIRMDDVRLYIRDALKEYASLQSGDVQPTWNADCYTGELLLEQFGFPPQD